MIDFVSPHQQCVTQYLYKLDDLRDILREVLHDIKAVDLIEEAN